MTRPDHEETIFMWGAPPLKFGVGAADEIGFDLSGFGVRRVLVVTDPGVNAVRGTVADRGRTAQRHLRAAELLAPQADRVRRELVIGPALGERTRRSVR